MLDVPLAFLLERSATHGRPVAFMPMPWTTRAAVRRPVTPSAIGVGWNAMLPSLRVLRRAQERGDSRRSVADRGAWVAVAADDAEGGTRGTHQLSGGFQRTCGQLARSADPCSPGAYRQWPLASSFAAELVNGLAVLEVAATLAVVMDGLAVHGAGHVELVESRQRRARHPSRVLNDDCDQVWRD